MANYNNLKATINANIKANGNEEITGPILNTVLNQAVTTLGDGWSYKGIATPSMSPGTPDSNVFYIATTAGTYTNFGSLVVAEGEVAILKYNGSWAKEVTGAATAAQVTQLGQEVGDFSLPIISGKTVSLGGTIGATINLTPQNEVGWNCVVSSCVEGDSFIITGRGGSSTRLWGFVDAENKLIAVSTGGLTGTNLKVIAPANSANFVSNGQGALSVFCRKYGSLPNVNERLDNITTDVEDISTKVTGLSQESVKKSAGVNLVDPSTFVFGKGIRENGITIQNFGGGYSGYIPVNGQNISSNAYFTSYWGGAVYDANKNFLRALSSNPYVYQDGDGFIRLTFDSANVAQPRANYGDTLKAYEPYEPIGGYIADVKSDVNALKSVVNTLKRDILLPNAPENVQKAIVYLYLEGIDPTEEYYVGNLSMDDNGRVTLYVRKKSDYSIVSYCDTQTLYDRIAILKSASGSNATGYALIDMETGEAYTLTPYTGYINLDKATAYDYPFKEIWKSDCFVNMRKTTFNGNEPLLLKCVKAIQLTCSLIGNYAIRYIGKTDNAIYLIAVDDAGAEISRYEFSVDLSGESLKHITATYSGMSLDMVIDLSSFPGKGAINVYGDYYNWWIKPENIIITSSVPTEGDNSPISSSAVASALAGIDPEAEDYMTEIAKGLCASQGTYISELQASPLNDNVNDYNVGYAKALPSKVSPLPKDIIMFNHDDGAMFDLVATRKIYNKYGYRGSFCMILRPFTSLTGAKDHITNGRKLLKDGHEMGLHAIMNTSYWDADRHFDVMPSGGSLFAPKMNELKGSNSDGTGVNIFGQTITSDTRVQDIYHNASIYDDGLWNVKVVDLTQSQVDTINSEYCFYSDKYIDTGIDDLALTDIMKASSAANLSKTRLQWLEYWYNGLIDNTLGYSSTESDIAAKFAEDYDVPSGASPSEYYPDAAHMLNGKMVYYGDTSNPHYNDSSYQKVGRFTKGLYKGCFSTCNWEVMSRVVQVAQAFFRKYYGMDHFTDQHLHGVAYVEFYYKNSDAIAFLNREMTIPVDNNGQFYSTLIETFTSKTEILSAFRCESIISHERRTHSRLKGQRGNYYGVGKIKSPWNYGGFNSDTDMVNYLAMFGTTSTGQEIMSYSNFMTYMDGVDNWLKFCYDNAGQSVTRNGLTMNVYNYIKTILVNIVSVKGSGKVPLISVDTLLRNPSIVSAIDILFRTFKKMGYQVVSYEEGMRKILSQPRETGGNLFPNPCFVQTLKQLVGESDIYTKIPDGWSNFATPSSLLVDSETFGGNTYQVLTIEQGYLKSTIYGLPGGTYRFKVWAKTNSSGRINAYLGKNGDVVGTNLHRVATLNVTGGWAEYSADFTIPAQFRNVVDVSDPISVICDGCQDNVCSVYFILSANSGEDISIALPRFKPLIE